MNNYELIKVGYGKDKKLVIDNPTSFELIGLGGMGAVFKLDDLRCIKIYADPAMARQEKDVYMRAGNSAIMPQLYDAGERYIVMEYVKGPDLKEHLLSSGRLSNHIARELVDMFTEMERLGFSRRDESLRHILLKDGKQIKVIDHYYAFSLYNPYPVKLFKQLADIGMLEPFLISLEELSPKLYEYFQQGLPEYFKMKASKRRLK